MRLAKYAEAYGSVNPLATWKFGTHPNPLRVGGTHDDQTQSSMEEWKPEWQTTESGFAEYCRGPKCQAKMEESNGGQIHMVVTVHQHSCCSVQNDISFQDQKAASSAAPSLADWR